MRGHALRAPARLALASLLALTFAACSDDEEAGSTTATTTTTTGGAGQGGGGGAMGGAGGQAAVGGQGGSGAQPLQLLYRNVNHMLATGQSLSVGAQGTPALSLDQPDDNVMFVDGVAATANLTAFVLVGPKYTLA